MALEEFWRNVRSGVRFFKYIHVSDAPRLSLAQIEAGLRADLRWLTYDRVAGYDEADFDFLPPEERQRLTRLVRQVEPVTQALPLVKPPATEQVEAALIPFRDLVQMLEFDRYADPEALRLGKRIEARIAAERPPVLAELRFNTGRDWAGGPGLWIWGYLTDDPNADPMVARPEVPALDKLLLAAADRIVRDRFPFIGFRTLGEQAELLEERAHGASR